MSSSRSGARKAQDEGIPSCFYEFLLLFYQNAKKCSKNDRKMTKGHGKQTEGAPTGQI